MVKPRSMENTVSPLKASTIKSMEERNARPSFTQLQRVHHAISQLAYTGVTKVPPSR
jgi:hypothetical protein